MNRQEVLAHAAEGYVQRQQFAGIEWRVDVAGETRRLEGSATTQYAEWRKLLREIYEAETGLPAVTEVADEESPTSP